jgi:hypothetical protein
MAAGPAYEIALPQAMGGRIAVVLIPEVADDLRRLRERTNLSTTDLANRAITVYEFIDAQLRAGHEMVDWDTRTGMTQLVQFQEAPAGQELLAGPASLRRGRTGPMRRAGRHRLGSFPVDSRPQPAGSGWLQPMRGLAGQEVKVR